MECTFCLEMIPDDAAACSYCGAEIDGEASANVIGEVSASPARSGEFDSWTKSWRAQFEERRVVPPPEMAAQAEKVLLNARREMRRASFVFSDLVSFSGHSQGYSPESIGQIIQQFHQIVIGIATRYRGFIVRFQADGVFLVFGAPISFDRDTENAVLAAREIVKAVEALKWPDGELVQARAGVATGRVYVSVQPDEGEPLLLLGDSVNLAARLEGKAEHGGVLLCRSTARTVSHRFDLEPSEPLQLKNMDQGYIAMKLMGEKVEQFPSRQNLRFRGRAVELQRMHDWLDAIGEGFSYGIVSGQAGIGKSRLIREFAVQRRQYDAIFLSNSSSAQFVHLSPLIAWLSELLDLPPEASPSETALFISQYIDKYLPELSPESVLISYLFGDAQSVKAIQGRAPAELRHSIFSVLFQVMRFAARRPNVLVIVDDLQWADESTQAWVEWLKSQQPTGCKLVLLVREEGKHVIDSGADLQLHLTSLDSESANALLREALGERQLSSEQLGTILQRSGKNTFYALELVRELNITIQGDISDERLSSLLPDSVQEVIQWRIDRLEQQSLHVLQVGAVIGEEFSSSLLARIEEIRQQLVEQLQLLKAKEYIEERVPPPEELLGFAHSLLRETAYQMLLEEERQKLHGEAALALQQAYPEPDPEIEDALAYHWERSGQPENAVKWMLKAVHRREALGAAREAARFCQRGIELIESKLSTPDKLRGSLIRLLLRGGSILVELGSLDEGEELLERGKKLATQANVPIMVGEAEIWLAVIDWKRGDLEEAVSKLDKIAGVFDLPARLSLYTCALRANIERQRGNTCLALEHYTELEQLIQSEDAGKRWLADLANSRGLAHFSLGDMIAAAHEFQSASSLYRESRYLHAESRAEMHLGMIAESLGDGEQAAMHYEKARKAADSTGYLQIIPAIEANSSNLLRLLGRPGDAIASSMAGAEAARKTGSRQLEAYNLINLACAQIDSGRIGEALTTARDCRKLIRNHDSDLEAALWVSTLTIESRFLATPVRHVERYGSCLQSILQRVNGSGGMLELSFRVARCEILFRRVTGEFDLAEQIRERELNRARELNLGFEVNQLETLVLNS